MHGSLGTWFVGKDSDHLQLIKFWPSLTSGKGVCGVAKIVYSALLQPACSVRISLGAFFIMFCVVVDAVMSSVVSKVLTVAAACRCRHKTNKRILHSEQAERQQTRESVV